MLDRTEFRPEGTITDQIVAVTGPRGPILDLKMPVPDLKGPIPNIVNVSDRIPPVVYWKKINDVNNRGYKRQPSNKITKIIRGVFKKFAARPWGSIERKMTSRQNMFVGQYNRHSYSQIYHSSSPKPSDTLWRKIYLTCPACPLHFRSSLRHPRRRNCRTFFSCWVIS